MYKLSRKELQPRRFLLCSDCLIYMTMVQGGAYRINREIPLTGMRIVKPHQDDFEKELQIISSTRSFTLSANKVAEREEWYNLLCKAIEEHAKRRGTFTGKEQKGSKRDSNNSLTSQSSTESSSPGTTIGEMAPVWISDDRVTMCQICTAKFSVTFRRHHCRGCGKVCCEVCSADKAPLKYLKWRKARVCLLCFDELMKIMTIKRERKNTVCEPLEEIDEKGFIVVSNRNSDVPQENGGGLSPSTPCEEIDVEILMNQFERSGIRASARKQKIVAKVLKEVSADSESTLSGYLQVRKSKNNWKRHWYVIKDMVLYSYAASQDVQALQSLPLLGWTVSGLKNSVDGCSKTLLFEVKHPGQPSMVFRAESTQQRDRWIKAMELAVVLD